MWKHKGRKSTTISGEPQRPRPPFGSLQSQPGADLSQQGPPGEPLSPPAGLSDTQFIDALLSADSYYRNNNNSSTPYNFDPDQAPFFAGLNSNSYTAGILNDLGLQVPKFPGNNWTPGFDKPVSNGLFGGEQKIPQRRSKCSCQK